MENEPFNFCPTHKTKPTESRLKVGPQSLLQAVGCSGIKQCAVNCDGGPWIALMPLADNNSKTHLTQLK